MRITLLHCPKSKHGPYHLVYHLAAWPAGTVRSRGWTSARVIYEREAKPAEVQEYLASTRYPSWRYRTWQELRDEEALYGVDADTERDRYYRPP